MKIFNDTLASDLAELIAEFNPNRRPYERDPAYKMGFFKNSDSTKNQ